MVSFLIGNYYRKYMRGEVGVGVYSALFLVLICTRMVTILVCEICACVWAPLPKTAHFHNLMIIKENNGAPDRIRTCDLCLGRAALYPAELRFPHGTPPTTFCFFS